MTRLGMVIALARCVGCQGCTVACKAEHGTPAGVFWARVLEKETGKFPSSKRFFIPLLCNHCETPACLEVCPTGATYKREDGIVLIDYDKCIGCRYCMMACPYNVRFFLSTVNGYFSGNGRTPYEEKMYDKWQVGTVVKCTLCAHRVDQGLEPACVVACPTSARIFGDIEDPNSEPSVLIRERAGFQLLPDAGTNPSVWYLPP